MLCQFTLLTPYNLLILLSQHEASVDRSLLYLDDDASFRIEREFPKRKCGGGC